MTFVRSIQEFKQNLAARFSSNVWLGSIDFSKWVIVEGCVLNALCESPVLDTKQPNVNLMYYMHDILNIKKSIDITIDNLNKTISPGVKNQLEVEQVLGTTDFNVFLPYHVRLNFSWILTENSKNPFSHIPHSYHVCNVYMRLHETKSYPLFHFSKYWQQDHSSITVFMFEVRNIYAHV